MIKIEDYISPSELRNKLKHAKSSTEYGIDDALYRDPISGLIVKAKNGPALLNEIEGYTDEDGVVVPPKTFLMNDFDLMKIKDESQKEKDPSKIFTFNKARDSQDPREFSKLCFYMNHVPVEQRLKYKKVIFEALSSPKFLYMKDQGKSATSNETRYTPSAFYGDLAVVALPLHDQAGADVHCQYYVHSRCITDQQYDVVEAFNQQTKETKYIAKPKTTKVHYFDEEGNQLEKEVVDKRRHITARHLLNKTDFLDCLCDYINEKLAENDLPLLKSYNSQKRWAFKTNKGYGEELNNYFEEFGIEQYEADVNTEKAKMLKPVDDSFDEKIRTVMSDAEIAESSLSDEVKLIQKLKQEKMKRADELQAELRKEIDIVHVLKSAEVRAVELAQTKIDLRKEKETTDVLSRQNDELTASVLAVNNVNDNLKEEIKRKDDIILEVTSENLELEDNVKELERTNKELNDSHNKYVVKTDEIISSLKENIVEADLAHKAEIKRKDEEHASDVISIKTLHKEEIERIDIENENRIESINNEHNIEKEELAKTYTKQMKEALTEQHNLMIEEFKNTLKSEIQATTESLRSEFAKTLKEELASQKEANDKVIESLNNKLTDKDEAISSKNIEINKYRDTVKKLQEQMIEEKNAKKQLANEVKNLSNDVKSLKTESDSVRKTLGIDDNKPLSEGVKNLVGEFQDILNKVFEKYNISVDDINNPKHTIEDVSKNKPKPKP